MKRLLIAIVAVLSMTACVNPISPDGGGGNGGGGSVNYYVSASGCTVGSYGSYSYSGGNSSTCYSYYNAAVAARCTKILWKCN